MFSGYETPNFAYLVHSFASNLASMYNLKWKVIQGVAKNTYAPSLA